MLEHERPLLRLVSLLGGSHGDQPPAVNARAGIGWVGTLTGHRSAHVCWQGREAAHCVRIYPGAAKGPRRLSSGGTRTRHPGTHAIVFRIFFPASWSWDTHRYSRYEMCFSSISAGTRATMRRALPLYLHRLKGLKHQSTPKRYNTYHIM